MKFPVWATVFMVVCAVLLFRLGFWQLERHEWKASLLKSLDEAYAIDASAHPLLQIGARPEDLHEYERGYVEGEYLFDRKILLGPRLHDKAPGYHLLVPLKIGGIILFVNRGWVPEGYSAESDDSIRVRVTGLLRTPDRANFSVPLNNPEKNLWFRYDLEGFAKSRGISPVLPFVLYAETESFPADTPRESLSPLPQLSRPQLSNNHLSYAFFWFTMGVLLIFFYLLRFHNKSSRES
ncbi:MAG: SURF1 family protein [Rhodospirillales bacterium]|nr:SURF1 family protein [Rhodospirillales bacterium]